MRCSGRAPSASRAIVVRGRQATWKCRRLKSELRKALHCTSYRNLIAWVRRPGAVPYAGILIRGLTMPGHVDSVSSCISKDTQSSVCPPVFRAS